MIKKLLLSLSIICASSVYAQTFGQFQPIVTPLPSSGSGSSGSITNLSNTNNTVGVVDGGGGIGTNTTHLLSTNTVGAQVNALTAGFTPTASGATNRVILQYLVNSGVTDIYIPAGVYPLSAVGSQFYVPSNSAPVTIWGDEGKTIITNISTSGLLMDFQAGSCVVKGITFTSGITNQAATASRIWIKINAVGFPKVENCNFISTPGTAISVVGDPNITYRSNHWTVANCTFSNAFNGIVCATNSQSEYGTISGNMMTAMEGDCISGGGANMLIVNNNINGWQDHAGGSGTPRSTGIRWMSDNGRGHSVIANNIFNHHLYSMVASNLAGVTVWSGNTFMGGASNVIVGCSGQQFIGNMFDPYGGTVMSSCANMSFGYNTFNGNLYGFTKGSYNGGPNYLFGYGPSTNDSIWTTNLVGSFINPILIGSSNTMASFSGNITSYGGAIIRSDGAGIEADGDILGRDIAVTAARTLSWRDINHNYIKSTSVLVSDFGSASVTNRFLGQMQFGAGVIASNGYISPPLVCTTDTTNWSGQGLIVTHTNTTIFMSLTGQEGKRVVVTRSPLNSAVAGAAILFCTNGSFFTAGTGTYATNYALPISGNAVFNVYGTNFMLEY